MFRSFNPRALGIQLNAEQTLEIASRAGFDSVDLLVRDLFEEETSPKDILARMQAIGLRGGAWPLPMHWRGDFGQYQRDLLELPRYAAAARCMGLARTATWVLPERPIESSRYPEAPHDFQALFDWHVQRLVPIAKVLEDHGSRLGLEAIGVRSFRAPGAEPFIASLAGLMPLLAAIKSEVPGVGLLVDAFHLLAAGESADTVRQFETSDIVWVHLADLLDGHPLDLDLIEDQERGLPGAGGPGTSAELLRLLKEVGYSGPVTVETITTPPALAGREPAEIASATMASLRKIWP